MRIKVSFNWKRSSLQKIQEEKKSTKAFSNNNLSDITSKRNIEVYCEIFTLLHIDSKIISVVE